MLRLWGILVCLHFFYIFLDFSTRRHYLMTATEALQLEIRPNPESPPKVRPAGVLFFQLQNIADFDVHGCKTAPKMLI